MPIKEKQKNAVVTAEKSKKNEKYLNLFVEFGDIKILVVPVCKDKKTLAKLMYKIGVKLGVYDE